MPRCHHCRRRCAVIMICKGCDMEFCTGCRLPETHACAAMESLKSAKLALLKETLERQKTESSKIVKL